jgi:hypothetical protein
LQTTAALIGLVALAASSGAFAALEAPEVGGTELVSGVAEWPMTERDGRFRSGPMTVTTKLPLSYPRPTPAGVMELKTYPVVRQAVVTGGGRSMNGFFPLFRHISNRDIAMTAPVVSTFSGLEPGDEPGSWSMAFLYERFEDGPVGAFENGVIVEDEPPITVLSVGVRGAPSAEVIRERAGELEAWVAASPGWTRGEGRVRVLQYNGPSVPMRNRWAEVQIPVERSAGEPTQDPDRTL